MLQSAGEQTPHGTQSCTLSAKHGAHLLLVTIGLYIAAAVIEGLGSHSKCYAADARNRASSRRTDFVV